MNNKELNLIDLVNAIKKYKILMLGIFLLTAIISTILVLQVEKTYKSVLIVNMPIQEGIETEYTIDVLSKTKSPQLNRMFGLNKDSIKLTEISLSQIRHEPNSTYGVVEFITTKPDLNHIVKNKFISYLNNLDFFKKLKEMETEKYKDIVNTINNNFNELNDANSSLLEFDNKNNPVLLNPVNLKEQLHEAKINLSFTDSIVEVSYMPMPEKFKPSYAMLVIMALLFSFFVALTSVIITIFFKEFSTKN